MTRPDSSKVILTFTVTQWKDYPDAMLKMAEVAHSESIPVNWQLHYESAVHQKETLNRFHAEYGDEIVVCGGETDFQRWRLLFPWARITVVGSAKSTHEEHNHRIASGLQGVWGFCDQQIGVDGITHWGCPWGMFYISEKTTFTPSQKPGGLVGIPWTLRDLHKVYHLNQPINFCVDPIEMVRSKNLCWGEDITYFQEMLDELINNTGWNDRVYCCVHEEADGPFIFPGCERSNEGADPVESEAMYVMMKEWLRYAKERGVTIMTLPDAVADYRMVTGETSLPSTLLTRDKMHGKVRYYIPPLPEGIKSGDIGPAGHFPDTLFHFDSECQLVFTHPNPLPVQILDYSAEHETCLSKPYPKEQVLPSLLDWNCVRENGIKTYRYKVQSWYPMPCGIAEWGNFHGWEIIETNALSAKIIDDRIILMRINLASNGKTAEEINNEAHSGKEFWVKLKRVKDDAQCPVEESIGSRCGIKG